MKDESTNEEKAGTPLLPQTQWPSNTEHTCTMPASNAKRWF